MSGKIFPLDETASAEAPVTPSIKEDLMFGRARGLVEVSYHLICCIGGRDDDDGRRTKSVMKNEKKEGVMKEIEKLESLGIPIVHPDKN